MSHELAAERQQEITQMLKKEGKVIVSDLAKKYDVTFATIRRDLDILNEKDQLVRVHGGAIFPDFSTSFEPQYSEKSILNNELKKRIGVIAASLVKDGDTIYLDSGTTAFQVAENLREKNNLKIITPDLKIGCLLATSINHEVILIGGKVRTNQFNCVGAIAQEIASDLNADIYFLALDGFDLDRGVTVTDLQEAAIKKIMIESSKEVVAITDHTKIGRISMVSVCPLSKLDVLITDDSIDKDVVREIEEMKIQVLLA